MRWLGSRLQLLVVALVVLLGPAAADRAQYFCKMMGRAVDECCCPGAHESRPAGATLRAADCCELVAASTHPPLAAHAATPAHLSGAMLAATLPALEYPRPSFRLVETPASLARAPPPNRTPLFISHCALLI